MSQENVEVVRRFYAEFARDLASEQYSDADLEGLFDPEISVDQTRRALNPATYHGYEGVLRGMREIRERLEAAGLEVGGRYTERRGMRTALQYGSRPSPGG